MEVASPAQTNTGGRSSGKWRLGHRWSPAGVRYGSGGRRRGGRSPYEVCRGDGSLFSGRTREPQPAGADAAPSESPRSGALRTRSRERLHEWGSSFKSASSCVAVVAVATCLALPCRCRGGSVVPLGCRDARRRLSRHNSRSTVVAGNGDSLSLSPPDSDSNCADFRRPQVCREWATACRRSDVVPIAARQRAGESATREREAQRHSGHGGTRARRQVAQRPLM